MIMETKAVFFIGIPVEEIASGIMVAKQAIRKQRENAQKAHELGTEEAVRLYAGEKGVQERAKELEMLRDENKAIAEDAVQRLEKLHEQAVAAIHKQTDPNGHDLIAAAEDVALLNAEMIGSVEELNRLFARHADSYTIYRLCGRYAKTHGWDINGAFPFDVSKPGTIIEFTNAAFNGLSSAAQMPDGIAAEQYTATADEWQRMATAYEIKQEFEHSHGEKLREIVLR